MAKGKWKEHFNPCKSKSKTGIRKGTYFKPIEEIYSPNPEKTEKTIKELNPYQKKYLAKDKAKKKTIILLI